MNTQLEANPPHFIALVRRHLPLVISSVVLDEGALLPKGDNWSFATSSAWRVASSDGFHFGSDSATTKDQLDSLLAQAIVAAVPFGTANLDMSFTLSGGVTFECFSATDEEPWELRLPGESIIIADGTAA